MSIKAWACGTNSGWLCGTSAGGGAKSSDLAGESKNSMVGKLGRKKSNLQVNPDDTQPGACAAGVIKIDYR
jgi:hypothetical protein